MPVLGLRSLRKSFFSGQPGSPRRTDALLGVELDVEAGEILGVVGNEAAGKTTLLLCAAGMLRHDGGSIRWFGERFAGGGCLPGLVYVPAVPTYYPFLTVRDVLHYYTARDSASSGRHARLIADTAARLALSDFLATRISNLPVETLKRVAIAQAIVDEPKVLLLDGALDNLGDGAVLVHRLLREAAIHDATIIATSRQLGSLASVATRIAVMDRGQLTGSFASVIGASVKPIDSIFAPLPAPLRHIAERVH